MTLHKPPVQPGLFPEPTEASRQVAEPVADLLSQSEPPAESSPSYSRQAERDHEAFFLDPGWLYLFPRFLPEAQADELLRQLLTEVPWRQDRLRIMGREMDVPRLQCWMADSSLQYGYSGLHLRPSPWIEPVKTILQAIESKSEYSFNSVLLNQYRDGRDSVSWHADDEAELGDDPVIASVSLGASRRFQLKPKQLKPGQSRSGSSRQRRRISLELRHGSLLIMGKGIQSSWLHQVPKQAGETGRRINLTFRLIKRSEQQACESP